MSAFGTFVRRATLWPTASRLNEKIGCWGEIGRVIHWAAAAIACNVLVICIAAAIFDSSADPAATMTFAVVAALVLYLPARGLRRLMAGE